MTITKCLSALLAAAMLSCACAETSAPDLPVEVNSDPILPVETRLAELGYLSGEPNDTYDAETRSALESFQQANGLDVTGTVNDQTLEKLNGQGALSRQDYLTRFANAYAQMTPMQMGDASNDVLAMQRKLKDCGFYAGEPDGAFDDATRLAVERFQHVNGLTVTGVADGSTLMRLMADNPITWTAWLSEMSATEGDAGLNVYDLQRRLAGLGYYGGSLSASFGELTRDALTRYQRDHGIEPNGVADPATWASLFAAQSAAVREDGALLFGDSGEAIRQAQERLNALGFFDHEITGKFSYTTETAVRLFQMASQLPSTGALDARTQALLASESAASMLDEPVQLRFKGMVDAADSRAQSEIAGIARGLLGASFGAEDDELYPGFSFVQYVCVAAGLPITFPEDLIRMADRLAETLDAVEAGDIVAFQSASSDAITITLTIGAGNGLIYGATASGGWVIVSTMDQMEGATIYCWDAGSAVGE